MKKRPTLIYITNKILLVLILLIACPVHAQNDSIAATAQDTTVYKLKYGLRIGGDVAKLLRSTLDDDYKGFEVMADYRLKKKLYLAGELGVEEKTKTTDYLTVITQGSYLKVGVDYNLYQNWLDMDNMVFAGLRIGGSAFNHRRTHFKVYSTNAYWAPQFSSSEEAKFSNLFAVWAEFIVGLKAELFKNLYLGLNVQLKALVNQKSPDGFDTIYIPGFHRTYDGSRIGVGYAYTISYRIPFYKSSR